MKILFTFLSILPKSFYKFCIRIFMTLGLHKISSAYRVTKINIKIARPLLNSTQITQAANSSYAQSLISICETFYAWSRNPIRINNNILVVKNNFLIHEYIEKQNGLVVVAIHNRSVDMLLSWINSQTNTVSLYKKIKLKMLDTYVRKIRENNVNKTFETSVLGVKKILKAL
ncbi:lipid A biosynthesis lauroyl acyltransferase, partial [Gammaproteobacteria bacterium]|nr:lipid A biosynthesis lauroyl acyltransferase [Gammaproteobacteria bacterium]